MQRRSERAHASIVSLLQMSRACWVSQRLLMHGTGGNIMTIGLASPNAVSLQELHASSKFFVRARSCSMVSAPVDDSLLRSNRAARPYARATVSVTHQESTILLRFLCRASTDDQRSRVSWLAGTVGANLMHGTLQVRRRSVPFLLDYIFIDSRYLINDRVCEQNEFIALPTFWWSDQTPDWLFSAISIRISIW
jgi:hypothetical protein